MHIIARSGASRAERSPMGSVRLSCSRSGATTKQSPLVIWRQFDLLGKSCRLPAVQLRSTLLRSVWTAGKTLPL
jgi:hypothetical protein